MNNRPIIASTSWVRALNYAHEKGMSSSGFDFVDHHTRLMGLRGSKRTIIVLMEKDDAMQNICHEAQFQHLTLQLVACR